MIQRIQSVWLFLAALVMAVTLYFSIYKLPNGNMMDLQNNYLGIILVAASVILSLIALFSFKKRNTQLNLIWLNLLIIIALLVWIFISISKAKEDIALQIGDGGSYQFGAFIPVVVIVLLFLARSGIKKDIKLLRSYDRLR